jgi:dihydroorotase
MIQEYTYIYGGTLVNEGEILEADILIKDKSIHKILKRPVTETLPDNVTLIDASRKHILPGVIDDQVHFREPGLTQKANIYSESRAAVAGGTTSFMEMPNTSPQTVTIELLEDKYHIASQNSLANYSFYMGATNDNIDEIVKVNPKTVCGLKIFMGSSTGNMLVDDLDSLHDIFSRAPLLIATHCEDEQTIRNNTQTYRDKFKDQIPFSSHPEIRSTEACFLSSSLAVRLAKEHNSRLHVLHISTEMELELFDDSTPLEEKRITAEVCVHHLWFDQSHYKEKGGWIKWNPAVKSQADKEALINGVLQNKLDVIATDHAPHTVEEKTNPYLKCPSGGPMVQHSLVSMLELYHKGLFSLELIVEKMCHAPAKLFRIDRRGFIREGYYADLTIVDLDNSWTVAPDNILYKCGWSPMDGVRYSSKVSHTIINGHHIYNDGVLHEPANGMRLDFNR